MALELPKGAVLLDELELPEGAVLLGEELQKPKRSVPNELARQVGLTGRYALEGGGSILDLLATPVRGGINLASEAVGSDYRIPEMSIGKKLSDMAGLPNPETPTERVVGEASKFLTSVAGILNPF